MSREAAGPLVLAEPAAAVDALGEPAEEPLWPHELRVIDAARQPAWLRGLNRFIAGLSVVLKAIATAAFAALLLIAVVGVVFRYALNSPLTWAESLALWFLIWMTFAGAPYPLAEGTHYAVEGAVRRLPRPVQRWVALGNTLLMLAFCALLAWYGVALTAQNVRQVAPALDLPYAIPYAAVPLCFLAMCVILVRDLAELALGLREGRGAA